MECLVKQFRTLNEFFNNLYKGYETEIAFHEDMIEELYKRNCSKPKYWC